MQSTQTPQASSAVSSANQTPSFYPKTFPTRSDTFHLAIETLSGTSLLSSVRPHAKHPVLLCISGLVGLGVSFAGYVQEYRAANPSNP